MKLTSTINTICLLLGLLAIVGKALHIPGMAVILIISLGISSILFFLEVLLSIFYFKNYGRIIAISTIACMGLSVVLVGVLFRFMFWPGSMPMVIISLPFLLTALILAGANLSALKTLETDKRTIFNRGILFPAIFFLILGIVSLVLPPDIFWNIFSSQAVR